MIILGIDPGTAIIGYGIVHSNGDGFLCRQYGVLRNSTADRALMLTTVARELGDLVREHKPDRAAVEKLFFSRNQKTAMAVSEMRGVILLTLAQHGIPVFEFTPLQVKQAVSGYGGAQKRQMQDAVQMLLGIRQRIAPDDAADALAIALCGATAREF